MLDAPRQDWAFYEERARSADQAWLRSLTPQEGFVLYADMFNLIWKARRSLKGDWGRLDEWRWREKLALRLRMVEAFWKRDELIRERTPPGNTG
jgi:hypothetical protein